jgi:hypothetical protein
MPKVIAKKKAKVKKQESAEASDKKIQRAVERAITDLEAESDERYDRMIPIYNVQDATTKEALDKMVRVFEHMTAATGGPSATVRVDGIPPTKVNIRPELEHRNFKYIAVRFAVILLDLGIQIANFDPGKLCADCGKKVKRGR